MTRPGQPAAEAGSGTDAASALAQARSKVGPAARAVVDDVAALADRAQALNTSGDTLREQARRQTRSLKAGDAKALRRMPIGELKEFAGRGARLGRLQRAGFRTVSDGLQARPQALEKVPCVGPRTGRTRVGGGRYAAKLSGRAIANSSRARRSPASTSRSPRSSAGRGRCATTRPRGPARSSSSRRRPRAGPRRPS